MQRQSIFNFQIALFLFLCFGFFQTAKAQNSYISFNPVENSFPLNSVTLFLDSQDHEGVHLVAEDLQKDFEKVTGNNPEISSEEINGEYPVIIGTIGNSKLIDELISNDKLDVSEIEGKWENFLIQIVENPSSNVEKALVIAGSDKRGTIFGMYDLSEKIGVSPWHWWADVPVKRAEELYVKPGGYTSGTPKVKYRGIFLNDEEPALGNWARETFGGINSGMYEQVFKLILRLKGNYLWPAMWGKAFYDDDPKNPELADKYGVVIGTSHHEPLMRAHVEWSRYGEGDWNYETNPENLRKFWREGMERTGDYESVVTVGMRGDGDEAMTEGTAIDLLETIVKDQREIIEDVTGKPANETPQVWALYKEVQDYYDQGMRVPDDVTLLLADDNWGNIRKLPDPNDAPREGGYGIYYHFDYVGGPRNYKWLNTTQIERVWEQMNLAYQYDATELWVVNVGDLKPMEFPISFFLDFAWDPEAIDANELEDYAANWAEKQFGSEYASEIADILNKYTKFNSRRKPEMLSPDTYSLVNYNEAENVVKDYNQLVEKAEEINKKLPEEYRDAYFQLVLFPVKASANLNELYVAAAKNRLYAEQGRAAANSYAEKVKELYEKDSALTEEYHNIADGKWNHMMSQNHIGYTYWQQPEEQVMPEVKTIEVAKKPEMGVAIEGSKESWPSSNETARLPEFTSVADQKYYVEIFNKGKGTFDFKVKKNDKWIQVSEESGSVSDQKRISVSIDWNKVPKGKSTGNFSIQQGRKSVKIEVPIHNISPGNIKGFVESNNYIAIEAANYSEKGNIEKGWTLVPNLGKTGSTITAFAKTPTHGELSEDNPYLAYDFHNFSTGEMKIEFLLSPTLDFHNKGGLRFAYSIDDNEPKIINMHQETKDDWGTSVGNNITRVISELNLLEKGNHTLKIWAIDSGIALQKIIIRKGDIRESYLGPTESKHVE
ncbi:glycosyl hydrolase 115 family protein [Salegentibacter sp. LM13S]|uniref:glycosyl hydrolase 115 family protein n=1 Tax=Salegentibacter lacus TaxID=2873599 RepID=UPI001CCB164F|nr:glycosyl hydrolase 115 family protein [Salegentibacter lacus]MBZ9631669.1 glycosyl hydrolase 115 family protein [Salegentibacter lacus]